MTQHEFLVGAQERFGSRVAIVPYQDHPARGFQNARELDARIAGPEPVERLPGNDEVGARVSQASGLGTTVHHAEVGIGSQIILAADAHFAIGFDPKHAIAVLQKYLCQQAGATADVHYGVLGTQSAGPLDRLHHVLRIMGTILCIVVHPVGESRFGIVSCFGHGCILT